MKSPENATDVCWGGVGGGDVYDVATAGHVGGARLLDRKKPALAPLSRGSRADRLFWSAQCFRVGSCFPLARMQERKERVQHGLSPQRALGVRQLWYSAHTGQGSHSDLCPSLQSLYNNP